MANIEKLWEHSCSLVKSSRILGNYSPLWGERSYLGLTLFILGQVKFYFIFMGNIFFIWGIYSCIEGKYLHISGKYGRHTVILVSIKVVFEVNTAKFGAYKVIFCANFVQIQSSSSSYQASLFIHQQLSSILVKL